MNTTTNSSAPSSPSGTTLKAATNSLNTNNESIAADKQQRQQQHDSDNQLPTKLARSRSLSDIAPDESPGGAEASSKHSAEPPAPATESLKVKIKTNSITNTIFATTTATNDSNNNTSNKINNISSSNTTTSNKNGNTISGSSGSGISNCKPHNESPTSSIKTTPSPASTPKSTNSRAGGRKSKQNNGDTSSATSNSTSNNSSFSSTGSSSPATNSAMSVTKAKPVTNNFEGPSMAENGKKTTLTSAPLPPTPLTSQQPQVQPILPTQQQIPLQAQSQQPPLPVLAQPLVSNQPPSTLSPTKPAGTTPTPTPSQTTPKPKTTRAKKQPAANNKNASATNAIAPPKQEAKTRTKKAKQTAEAKAAVSVAASAATTATTLASSQNLQPISSAPSTTAPTGAPSSASDKKATASAAKKRKPRAPPAADPNAQPTNPPKRTRKKKGDQPVATNDINVNTQPMMSSNMTLPPLSVNPQLLSVASNIPMGASPLMSNAPQPPYQAMQPITRGMPGMSPLDIQDQNQRYVSVSLSPYANHDYTNSLARQHSLSKLLFTSSSSTSAIPANPHSDEIAKAFEELRDQSWTHLSKCILEPAQQFDIPSLIGTLYELRADNEKQLKRVKELTLQREQLAAMNAKLDLSGPMMLQNLNQTSPGFASVVAGLQNSPKSLPNSSPSPAMNKSPIVPGGAYNHVPPGSSLGPPGILYDRSSPMVGMQTQHSGVNSLKSSMISTPSPPTSAFMAHGANNRAGLMTVNNSPYISNVHPSMSALNSLGGPAPPSYYPRQ